MEASWGSGDGATLLSLDNWESSLDFWSKIRPQRTSEGSENEVFKLLRSALWMQPGWKGEFSTRIGKSDLTWKSTNSRNALTLPHSGYGPRLSDMESSFQRTWGSATVTIPTFLKHGAEQFLEKLGRDVEVERHWRRGNSNVMLNLFLDCKSEILLLALSKWAVCIYFNINF